jgi:hypothetical protein
MRACGEPFAMATQATARQSYDISSLSDGFLFLFTQTQNLVSNGYESQKYSKTLFEDGLILYVYIPTKLHLNLIN